jgi:16S rRNA (uracil1498-N3)-methyltransferase
MLMVDSLTFGIFTSFANQGSALLRTNRLYCPDLPAPGHQFTLPEQQASYVGKVLRLKANDDLYVFDGKGGEYHARIVSVERREVMLELDAVINNRKESPLWIELGQVISRGDRMDYAIQKSVELGVSCISPLFSERCEVRLDAGRQKKRRQHWQQIVFSASEQSGRAMTPLVNQPVSFDAWLTAIEADVKLIFHPCDQHMTSHQHINGAPMLPPTSVTPNKVAILIGPEGGFTDNELQHCLAKDFIPLVLGPRILRTETAPVVALTFLQQRWGDIVVG